MAARISGMIGLVVFSFGFICWMLIGFADFFSLPADLRVLVFGHMTIGFLLLAFWFVGSGVKNISSAGAVVRGRTTRFGAFATVNISLFLGLLIAVNWLGQRYDRRADLTAEQVYSLAPQTKNVTENLKRPLKIVALLGVGGGQTDEEVKDRLQLYKLANSSKISTELVDIRTKPHLVDTYEMKAGNAIYIAYGEGEKKSVSRINETSEEAITNAIVKLTRGEAKKVYYVTGHGEPSLSGTTAGELKHLGEAIADEHITVEELFVGEKSEIPADAAAVILISPKQPLLAQEREILIKYADKGGHLLMMNDPRTTDDIREIAKHFGITVGNDVVIEPVMRLFDAPALGVQPMVNSFSTHAVTRELPRGSRAVFNLATSVSSTAKDTDKTTYVALFKTSPSAWGESSIDKVFDPEQASAEFEENDIKGPVSLAVAYERKLDSVVKDVTGNPGDDSNQSDNLEPKSTRVIVVGDSDWIVNANLQILSNRDLVLNMINWVAGEEGGVAIRPRSLQASATPIADSDFKSILVVSLIVPELLLLVGLLIWWSRRSTAAFAE